MLPSTTDDALFDNLPPQELLRYSRASSTAHDAVSSYIRRAFRLERVLGRYFSDDDILELRRMQYSTGALISGSTALQFFDRSYYPESDLDIYVGFKYRRDIALWLEKKGYTMQPYTKNPEANLHDVLDQMTVLSIDDTGPLYPGSFALLEFLKNPQDTKLKIQLLIVSDGCPLASILRFHSTCVMNFIAYDKAYALYPKGTFITRQTLVAVEIPFRRIVEYNQAFQKYRSRGWEVLYGSTDKMRGDPQTPFKTGVRRVGDSGCWTIPLLPKLDLPPSTMEANTWILKHHRSGFLKNVFYVIAAPEFPLKLSYTVAQALLPYLRDELRKQNSDGDQNVEDRFVAIVERSLVGLHSQVLSCSRLFDDCTLNFPYQ